MRHHIPSNSAFTEAHYDNPPNHIILYQNQLVFVSPVEPYGPPNAEADVERSFGVDFINLSEAFELHWNLSKYPQLAFIPRGVTFVNPLLGRLAHYKVMQGRNGRYQLEPELLQSWISLEDTLTVAISCLSSGLSFPMEVEFFPYPAEYHYRRSYVTHHRAVMAVKRSRDAFVVLIGLFSMFYSLRAERHFRWTVRPNVDRAPKVEDQLKAYGSLSDTTVQDLIDMHAVLGPRIGFVVNPGRCQWFQHYRLALMYSGVRFWIYWGKASQNLVPYLNRTVHKPSPFFYHIPDHNLLGRCVHYLQEKGWPLITSNHIYMLRKQRGCQATHETVPPDVQPGAPEHIPDVSPDAPGPIPTVQKPAELPMQFVKRRQREAEERKKGANPAELQRFEGWGREAARLGWTKKSKVYHWPVVGGVRRRALVERSEIEWCWNNTQDSEDRSPGQRNFNDVFNEWDICTEFDPLEGPPEVEETADTPPPSSKPPLPSSELVSARLPTKTLPPPDHDKRALVFSHAIGVDSQQITTPELDVVLHERYGFDVAYMSHVLRDGGLTPMQNTLSIEDAAKVLMEKNAVTSRLSECGVRHIVSLISKGSPVPSQFWDLKNSELQANNPSYFTFSALKLSRCDETDKSLEGYVVTPTSPSYSKPWVLFIESAVAVTQCIREGWGPSLEDVIQEACQRGYRIHLFVRENPTIPPRASPPSLFSCRVRSRNFTPSHFDFHAYQDSVKLLLMQQRLKATALRGGILGRICSMYITLDELLDGPSPDVLRYGLRWRADGMDFVFVEDFVSEDEVQLLCGFFVVDCSATGGRAGQTKLVSFFPSPDVWESSGIHPGMWSNSGEQKFKAIMMKLDPEVGKGSHEPIPVPVKSVNEWKSHLRLHVKLTKTFLTFVESEARAFLSNL